MYFVQELSPCLEVGMHGAYANDFGGGPCRIGAAFEATDKAAIMNLEGGKGGGEYVFDILEAGHAPGMAPGKVGGRQEARRKS